MRIGILAFISMMGLAMCGGTLGQATRVSVLYTGDPYPGQTPYIYMKVEPLLQVTPVQASRDHYAGISAEDIKRAIRIYMPRTYKFLVETYDIVIISDSNVASFTPDHLTWFKGGVEEGQIGLVMIGGHETYGTNGHHPDWGQTPVGNVLPVETVYGGYEGGRVEITDHDNEFMKSLPWRSDLPFLRNYASNMVIKRPGAEVLATTTVTWELVYDRKYLGWENPFFSTWDFDGKGRVFAMTGDWTPGGGWLFMQWDYFPDFATNLMLYCSKKPIPEDLNLVHTVRTWLTQLSYRRMMASSLVDFIERLGANARKVLLAMAEFDEMQMRTHNLYLQQNFDQALDAAKEAHRQMDNVEEVAEDAKNEALLWIYVSEWLSVTATSLLCGLAIWTLMIRRRLYRDVGTTTLRSR